MTIKEALEAQIADELKKLKDLSEGEEKDKIIQNLDRLYKLKLSDDELENTYAIAEKKAFAELEKIDNERTVAEAKLELDRDRLEHERTIDEAKLELDKDKLEHDKAQSESSKKSDFWDKVIRGCEITGKLGVFVFMAVEGFKFEEKGIFGSGTFKSLLQRAKIF